MSDFQTKQITYFKNPGIKNTEKTIGLAAERIKEEDIKKIVVATSSGQTGMKVIKAFKNNKNIQIIPVVLSAGSKYSGSDEWIKNRREFEKMNIKYVQGIQAFSGVERAIKERWSTAGPVMILSDALRITGEGFKVAIEVTVMATDTGLVRPDENIIAIAGTSRGADTGLVVKPAYSNKFFDFAIKEIICKPFTEGVKHEAR